MVSLAGPHPHPTKVLDGDTPRVGLSCRTLFFGFTEGVSPGLDRDRGWSPGWSHQGRYTCPRGLPSGYVDTHPPEDPVSPEEVWTGE